MDQRSSSVLPSDGRATPVPAWKSPENASALRAYLDATEAARVAIEARERARDALARVSSRPPAMRIGSERLSSRVSAYRIPLPEESSRVPDVPSSWLEAEASFAAAETEPAEASPAPHQMRGQGTLVPSDQQEATELSEGECDVAAPSSRRQTLPGMPPPSLPPASERVRRAVLPPKASLPPQSTRYRVVGS